MALPNVKITLANGQLGSVLQTNDGIVGMVLTGVAITTPNIPINTPFLVTSLDDATAKGLTSATNAFAYKHVKEFYGEAPIGTQLYLQLVASTMTIDEIADKGNADGAKKLLDYAAGTVRVLGIMTNDSVVTHDTPAHGINEDCYAAVTNLQSLANDYFNQQTPFRGIVGGTSFDGNVTNLTTAAGTVNRVAIVIGDTVSGAGAALGLLMGRIAAIPVQRKVSRVKDGALLTTTAFIDTTPVEKYANIEPLYTKGFISFRTFPNKSGYYFNGDPMRSDSTDDYALLCRGRVIDKAQILTYATFVEEVDDEVPVNTDGTLNAGYVAYLQQRIENQINLVMTANNEISSVACFIDPAQNVISTAIINIVLKITPVGYASDIEVQLGFANPALAA